MFLPRAATSVWNHRLPVPSVEHVARQPRGQFREEGDEHQPDDLDDDERNDAAVNLPGVDLRRRHAAEIEKRKAKGQREEGRLQVDAQQDAVPCWAGGWRFPSLRYRLISPGYSDGSPSDRNTHRRPRAPCETNRFRRSLDATLHSGHAGKPKQPSTTSPPNGRCHAPLGRPRQGPDSGWKSTVTSRRGFRINGG